MVGGFQNIPSSLKPLTNRNSSKTGPAITSEESTNEGDILRLRECLVELSFTIDPAQSSLTSFITKGSLECWMYCKYTFKCTVLKYDTIAGNCSLYSGILEFTQKESKPFICIVKKKCMEDELAETVMAAGMQNPGPGSEFLIRQIKPQMGCLTKVKSGKPDADVVEVGSYRVRWNTCAESNSWGLRRVEHETDKIKTQDFFQIFMIEEPDMCLDVYWSRGRDRRQVILTKCREIVQQEDSQIMFFCGCESNHFTKISIYSLSLGYDEVLYPDTASGPLLGLTFTTPSTLPGQAGCALSQFDTTHGRVKNQKKSLIFLPGEEVTVLCEPGFGVSALNYSFQQSLVCGEGRKTLPCSSTRSNKDEEREEGGEKNERNKKERKEKGLETIKEGGQNVKNLGFYILLGFGLLGSAVVLIELVLILLFRRKMNIEECPAIKSEESTKEGDILRLRDCLVELSFIIDPDQSSLASFVARGSLECWIYCKYTFKCTVLKYDTISGDCSLYTGILKFTDKYSKPLIYTVKKKCMEDEQAKKVMAAGMQNPGPGTEFLIRQTEPLMGCLTKVESEEPDADLVEVGGFRLIWNTCAKTNSWGLKRVEHESDKLEMSDFFQIFMIEEPDKCLDVHQSSRRDKRQVILTKCRKIWRASQEDSQIMFLKEQEFSCSCQTVYGSKFSIYSTAEVYSESLTWALYLGMTNDEYSGPLVDVTFTTPTTLPDLVACAPAQFATPNGMVENLKRFPFVLPGEEVTVLCEPGYGVSALNYTFLQSLVCGEGEKTLPCSLIGRGEDEENGSEKKGNATKEENGLENEKEVGEGEKDLPFYLRFYLLLGCGSLGSFVALLELVLILVIRRKRNDNEDNERCVQVAADSK
ncbi:hypothetical protein ACHWQZ_G019484 [Mnemiopsis leidyi]